MEKVIYGVLAVGGLAFLWTRIKGYFAGAKTAKLESELKSLKEKSNELVTKSAVGRESFLERYRKYKSGK